MRPRQRRRSKARRTIKQLPIRITQPLHRDIHHRLCRSQGQASCRQHNSRPIKQRILNHKCLCLLRPRDPSNSNYLSSTTVLCTLPPTPRLLLKLVPILRHPSDSYITLRRHNIHQLLNLRPNTILSLTSRLLHIPSSHSLLLPPQMPRLTCTHMVRCQFQIRKHRWINTCTTMLRRRPCCKDFRQRWQSLCNTTLHNMLEKTTTYSGLFLCTTLLGSKNCLVFLFNFSPAYKC